LEYQPPSIETRQALDELQRYLSDQLPPLMVADSISLLLERTPELAAMQIQAWTAGQYRGHRSNLPVSSYLFHALMKIHAMGEFKLVPREALDRYLESLGRILLETYCPEEEREVLAGNLQLLGQTEAGLSSAVELLHLPGGAGPVALGGAVSGAGGAALGGAPALSEEAARGLRRFSLLMEQLSRMPRVPVLASSAVPESQGNLISQILTTAAVSAQTSGELNEYLARLRQMGVEPRTDEVFKLLARALPGWGILSSSEASAGPPADGAPAGSSGDGAAEPRRAADRSSGPLEAMHKLIALSEDVQEGARRFSEMMQAAVAQFNGGALGTAVAMLELAKRIVDEKRLDPHTLKGILQRAHETLSGDRLAKLAEKPDKHAFLRRILSFFPAMQPRGLLEQLEHEPRRERRRLLLALLEVHGEPARAAAYEDMKAALAGTGPGVDPYHLRNLVYMLRRVPRPVEQPWDEELDGVIRLSGPDFPPIVRKEALATLGQMKHERAEQTLIGRVRELEDLLLGPAEPRDGREEVALLLDRAVYALSRFGTHNAWRAVVDHGLKTQPQLGDTAARLGNLAGQDLSADAETVARLLRALREALPLKVLGFAIPRGHAAAGHLVRALSGTTTPAVHHALDEIVRRFPDTDFAAAASKGLASLGAAMRPAEAAITALSGDLELFGLPNLLQSLADSHVTGTLVLADLNGETIGTLNLEGGRLRNCHVGPLRGNEALYQLFVKPGPGTFVLRSRRDGTHDSEQTEPPRDLLPLVLEAVRRHDEYHRARAMVPDGAVLKATGAKPRRPAEEQDVNFMRQVWSKVTTGATPEACEAAIASDSFRVRTLIAHWVEEGSLQIQ